mmetsp:Transcript_18638/g.58509  ORF Transcript_18638/g.58509 Transcript_18638/m.58509 type:complete len:200 (+) Transcript_18638:1028-1627(+)
MAVQSTSSEGSRRQDHFAERHGPHGEDEAAHAAGARRCHSDPRRGVRALRRGGQPRVSPGPEHHHAPHRGGHPRPVLGPDAHHRGLWRARSPEHVLVQRRLCGQRQVLRRGGDRAAGHEGRGAPPRAPEPREPRVRPHERDLRIHGGGQAEVPRRRVLLLLPGVPVPAAGHRGERLDLRSPRRPRLDLHHPLGQHRAAE